MCVGGSVDHKLCDLRKVGGESQGESEGPREGQT